MTPQHPRSTVAVAAFLALFATACTASVPVVQMSSTPTIEANVPMDAGGFTSDEEKPATWTDETRAAATTKAVAAVTAWMNVQGGESRWRAGVSAVLSADALEFYASVDPRNISPGAVAGTPSLAADTSPQLARVTVPTTTGAYEVLLNRLDDEPWAVQRVRKQ